MAPEPEEGPGPPVHYRIVRRPATAALRGWMFQRRRVSSRFGKPCRPWRVAECEAGRLPCGPCVPTVPTRSFLHLCVTAAGVPCPHSPHATCPGWAGGFRCGGGYGSDARCSLAFVTAAVWLLCGGPGGGWTGGVALGAGGHGRLKPRAARRGQCLGSQTGWGPS